ncbi:DUF3617 domain-containing protein [Sphingorhabdus sp.]|uniref:DUF3617 domain-containing protein n=1 Tax=Sphingorhabdus sp. TaxID=1902408 RepID=UPI0037CB058D
MNNAFLLYAFPGALLLSLAAAGVAKPDGDMALLDSLDRGMWQLRQTGGNIPTSKICLGKSESLVQIQHSGVACDQYVVRSSANSLTVSYTCPGYGQGLTVIRKEANRIIHIQSQGIENNSPFSFSAEGRRTGPC